MKLTSHNTITAAFAGFLYPFGGLIFSIWNFRKPYAKMLFYMFCLFVGYTFIYKTEGTILSEGLDGSRYAMFFMEAHAYHLTWNEIFYLVPDSVDYYNVTVTYILSRFTGDPKLLFLLYAAIMGYFLTQNLWFVLERLNAKLRFPTIMLLVLLGFVCPIWLINGVRMWTALHIFVYGVFLYVFKKKKLALLLCFLSVFVHFSYVLPCFILISYILIPTRKLHFFFFFFVVCFFIREIDLGFFRQILTAYLPDYMQPRIGYINDDYVEKVNSRLREFPFYIRYEREAYKYLVFVMSTVAYFLIERKKIVISDLLKNLFCFSLFFYGIGVIMSIAPTGHRYLFVANTFILSFFVLFSITQGTILFKKTIMWLSPFIILLILVEFRMAFGFLGPMAFIGNFIVASFIEINTPIIILIKGLIS